MKHKRVWSVLLCLVLALTLIPLGAFEAFAVEHYGLWVGGVEVTSQNHTNFHKRINFNPATNTLQCTMHPGEKLDGTYKGASIYYTNAGTLTIVGNLYTAPGALNGIFATNGSVVIRNIAEYADIDMRTQLETIFVVGDLTVEYVNMRIHSDERDAVVANNISINASGRTFDVDGSYHALDALNGSISLSGGTVNARATRQDSAGVSAKGSIICNGGVLNAEGVQYGIQSKEGRLLVAPGARVTARSTREGDLTDSWAVRTQQSVELDGSLTCEGGQYGIRTSALRVSDGGELRVSDAVNAVIASKEFAMTGGVVDVSGKDYGLLSGAITITGGNLTARGGTIGAVQTGTLKLSPKLAIVDPKEAHFNGNWILNSAGNPARFVEIGEVYTRYNVWVGATRVTERNNADVLGDGKVSYDPATRVLTLNDPVINDTCEHARIYARDCDLTIRGSAKFSRADYVILTKNASLILNGAFEGTASVDAIHVGGPLKLDGGSLRVSAKDYGILADTFASDGCDVYAVGNTAIRVDRKNVVITGGRLEAHGAVTYGVQVCDGDLSVTDAELDITGEINGITASDNVELTRDTGRISGGGEGILAENGYVKIDKLGLNVISADSVAIRAPKDAVQIMLDSDDSAMFIRGETGGIVAAGVVIGGGKRVYVEGHNEYAITAAEAAFLASNLQLRGKGGLFLADGEAQIMSGTAEITASGADAILVDNGTLTVSGTVKVKDAKEITVCGDIKLDGADVTAGSVVSQKGNIDIVDSVVKTDTPTGAGLSADEGYVDIRDASRVDAHGKNGGVLAMTELRVSDSDLTAQSDVENAVSAKEIKLDGVSIVEPTGAAVAEIDSFATIALDGKPVKRTVIRTAPKARVSFETGGADVPAQTVEAGGKVERPADPAREGYTFGGWFADEECTVPFDFEQPVTGDTQIYAKWVETAPVFTVEFRTDGGSAVPAQTVAMNDYTVRPEDPEKEGFTFGGWFADEACTELYDFNAPVKADAVVYAKWEDVSASGLRGDANLDGKVLANDARLVLRASAKLETLEGQGFVNCDLNGDGKLLAGEARKILRYSAKLEPSI